MCKRVAPPSSRHARFFRSFGQPRQALTTPTAVGDTFSMCLCSDGSYDTPEGLIISFPCRTDGQKIEIVQGVNLNEFSRAKFDASVQELVEEREAVKNLI